jgi:D-citramalate synthase
MARAKKYIEIMDTTLRDGEQTPELAYTPTEKLQLGRMLLGEVGVDRIEVGSARVSEGEAESALRIIKWATARNKADCVEILGFVDGGISIDWIRKVGGQTINLLTKGSEVHCTQQLRKTPEEHFKDVVKDIRYAHKKGLTVNVYLEDWSNGVRDSFQYVHAFCRVLTEEGVTRIMLPDTLGVLTPSDVRRFLDWMISANPTARFDFHGHNDYGLGTANSLVAVECGVSGVHTTVNGLGERAGNASLCEVAVGIHDKTEFRTHIKERKLQAVAQVVQTFSGKRVASNAPIVGTDVFTQTCGVHADGDKKGNLYANPLLPERFSRSRSYALGKLSGKASIDQNLANLGLELTTDERNRVLSEVIALGDKKKRVTVDDLPFIIADVLKQDQDEAIKINEYRIITEAGVLPTAEITVMCNGEALTASAQGDGGYDAFAKAVRKAFKTRGIKLPALLDYEVRIPPGGKTDALVETMIKWENDGRVPLITLGFDCDQIVAAIEATEKMLNIVVPPQLGS